MMRIQTSLRNLPVSWPVMNHRRPKHPSITRSSCRTARHKPSAVCCLASLLTLLNNFLASTWCRHTRTKFSQPARLESGHVSPHCCLRWHRVRHLLSSLCLPGRRVGAPKSVHVDRVRHGGLLHRHSNLAVYQLSFQPARWCWFTVPLQYFFRYVLPRLLQ